MVGSYILNLGTCIGSDTAKTFFGAPFTVLTFSDVVAWVASIANVRDDCANIYIYICIKMCILIFAVDFKIW